MKAPPPPQAREHPEPHESAGLIPASVMALAAAMTVFGLAYIAASNLGPAALGDERTLAELRPGPGAAPADGAAAYAARCAACHQANGGGVPGVFPPLAGSEWVQGDERRLAALVLHGVTGALTVKGTAYNGAMPAFGPQLEDGELAALLSHVRSRFGGGAAAIAPGTVAQVRAQTASRTGPYDGERELGSFR